MSRFYVASWSREGKGGVLCCELLPSGAVEVKQIAPLDQAGYLAWSPDRKHLYATCGCSEESDGIAAFAVAGNGDLTLENILPSGGISTCHLAVSANGKRLYCANYSSGNFAEFQLDEAGSLLARTRLVAHSGHGPNRERQEGPHTHFTAFTPDGRYVVVVDLGIDALKCYPFDPERGIDPEGVRTSSIAPAGSGPRHLVFSPDGRFAYLVNELGNTLFSLAYADGRFTKLAVLDLLPRGVTCDSKASAVRMTRDGRYVVATNRGFDSLVLAELDGRGGMTLRDLTLSGGSFPRDVNFLTGETIFAAGHEFTDNVRFFDFDAERGRLIPNGYELTGIPRPICFLPE